MKLKMIALSAALMTSATAGLSHAEAKTYAYDVACNTNSYSKQGEQQEDLTRQLGKPIRCDGLVISILDNGRTLFQFAEKKGNVSAIGFAGSEFDYDFNPNMVTVKLDSIYLPHPNSKSVPEKLSGIEGYCFIEGSANIRKLTALSCTAKIEIGTQRLVYTVEVRFIGVGKAIG